MFIRLLYTFVGLICCLAPTVAQDLHHSQFYLNPLHLTPAATGVFEGKWRVSGLYRSQWNTVPVAYETYAAAADWKAAVQRGKSSVSLGLLLQQDQAGDAKFTWAQAGLNLGVAHAIGTSSALSLGFGASAVQRTVDISKLKFKNQWAGDFFNPSLPSREPFGRNSGMAPSLSAGLMWHFQPAEVRHRATVGIGAFHLNRPSVSLGGVEEANLPIRATVFGEGIYQMREMTDLVFFAAAQNMRSSNELLFGAGLRQLLTTGLANETAIRFSLATRLGDAIIPAVQMERNNWVVGISYDWNISRFSDATNGRGGLEIAAVWRLIPVPVPKEVKCCPVF